MRYLNYSGIARQSYVWHPTEKQEFGNKKSLREECKQNWVKSTKNLPS